MEMWSIILALVAVVLAYCYYVKKCYDFFKDRGIPYHQPMPFLGSIWKGLLQRSAFAYVTQETYNVHADAKYVGFFEFMKPVVTIRDPELLKSVLVKNFDHFVDHQTFLNNELDPLFSKNLFSLTGDRWREVRAMTSPTFTSSKMKAMFKLMQECAEKYGEILATMPADKRVLDLKDTFSKYTNDVIATCAFGIVVDSMTDPDNKFFVYGKKATTFSTFDMAKVFLNRSAPWINKIFRLRLLQPDVDAFFKDVVQNNVRIREESGITRPDMIQLMMDIRKKQDPEKQLSIDDMTAQAFVFFTGGFESVSTLMSYAAYEVGINTEAQRKLQDEIDDVLASNDGQVSYESVNEMKYLDAVINETLRMYPIAVQSDRLCTKRFELPPALPGLDPLILEEGNAIQLPIYGIHYDPKYHKDPKQFNPDRFVDDPKKLLNSGTFIPFGMGPRNCIGSRFAIMEAKVLLFYLFAKCNVKKCSKTDIPLVLDKKSANLLPTNGFWLEIEPRSTKPPLLVNSVSASSVAY